ncbi:alpha/beta hydrolase [Virgibacillus sp. YIM 98842]|uniref:alpha/beta fold hydrolase n=1 Tax=Virgibacillus sp. YIM 98842 TaxID=2663533 RepID=UPI0013DD0A16|nr:alpha/beta hydrolase [Virgibacillus sp. YIM 98842]
MDHFTKTTIKLPNAHIYCEYILNGKPPLLLIHGLVASVYTFKKMMPLLEKDFSVIAIDLPGFGRSEKSARFINSYENFAKLIASCIDYFDLKEVYLAGHSMGGQISLYTAKLFPEKIKKLILLNSSGYLKPSNHWIKLLSYVPYFYLFIKKSVKKQGVRSTLEIALSDHSVITEEMIEEYSRPLKEKQFYKSLLRLARYREGDLRSAQVKQITTPVLLIYGEKDRIISLKVAKKLAKDLPNAKLLIHPNTGHLFTDEIPENLTEQIRSFALES